ncbi:YvcK family protein [Candidatus Woesearchaeota archaeon]|nr:YvcK family protein [Candidatus Woesearchaeota archaeon]
MTKIATLGGGSGHYSLLLGLKNYANKNPNSLREENISAIMPTSDNGGHTGLLLGQRGLEGEFLPPGDIRQCLAALANNDEAKKFFQYRIKKGENKGAVVGNIFLDAAYEQHESFEAAIDLFKKELDVRANVYPSTLKRTELAAILQKNKYEVKGEDEIVKQVILYNTPIERVFLNPKNVKANPKAIEAILNADKVVLAQGSLYTSLIPNLLVREIRTALKQTKADVIYVMNIVTQRGETDDFDVSRHLEVLEKYSGKKVIDKIMVNKSDVPSSLIQKYDGEGQKLVHNHSDDPRIIEADLITKTSPVIRHDPDKLAEVIMKL